MYLWLSMIWCFYIIKLLLIKNLRIRKRQYLPCNTTDWSKQFTQWSRWTGDHFRSATMGFINLDKKFNHFLYHVYLYKSISPGNRLLHSFTSALRCALSFILIQEPHKMLRQGRTFTRFSESRSSAFKWSWGTSSHHRLIPVIPKDIHNETLEVAIK